MLRKVWLACLLAPLLFSSCKKDDTPAVDYIINGVHDVTLNASGSNTLAVALAQTSGAQETVNLSVAGLPLGVAVDISPKSGVPAFASMLTFSTDGTTLPNTYPMQLVASSISTSKSYNFNLIVPKLSFWVADGTTFTGDSTFRNMSGGQPNFFAMDASGNNGVAFTFKNQFPGGNGTYNIVSSLTNGDDVVIDVVLGGGTSVFESTGAGKPKATITVNNGKMTINIPQIQMKDVFGTDVITLSGTIRE